MAKLLNFYQLVSEPIGYNLWLSFYRMNIYESMNHVTDALYDFCLFSLCRMFVFYPKHVATLKIQ